MVRILVSRVFDDGTQYIEGACVAADVAGLPTSGIVTGSRFIVVDTGDEYRFAEGESAQWYKTKAGPTPVG